MYTLRLLGPPALEGPHGSVSGRVTQERKLAVLAVLALSEGRARTRDSIAAIFWPESDSGRARHNVADTVWVIRNALGSKALLSEGNRLTLNPQVVATDVELLREAVEKGALEAAADLDPSRFMEGFHISGAPDFEHWLDGQRTRLAASHGEALEALVRQALARGRAQEAVEWARRLAAADPLHTGRALLFMTALAESGDPAGAVLHGERHVELLEEELGIQPPPEVEELMERFRTDPPGGLRGRERDFPTRVERRLELPGSQLPPGRRTAVWGGALLGMVVFGALLVNWVAPEGPAVQRPEIVADRIVVVAFENRTGDPELDLLGRLAADVLIRGLTQAGVGNVVLPDDMLGMGVGIGGGVTGPARARVLAAELGAGISVSGTIDPHPQGGLVVATVAAAPEFRVTAAPDPVPVDPSDPGPALERLSSRVVGTIASQLGARLPEHPFWVRTPSYEAYRAADRATRSYLDQDFAGAAAYFRQAYELDEAALGYLLWEAVAHWNVRNGLRVQAILEEVRPRRGELSPFDDAHFEWLEARLEGDLRGAARASRTAHGIYPRSGLGGFQLGLDLLRLGRLEEALDRFQDLDPDRGWLVGFRYYWYDLAIIYHLMGRHDEELALAEEGYRRFPGDELLTARLRALGALGQVDEMRTALRQSTRPANHAVMAAWALHRHGWGSQAVAVAEEGLRVLAAEPLPLWTSASYTAARREIEAQLLFAVGRMTEARDVFRELLATQARHPELLGWTGVVEARLGLEDDAQGRIRDLERLGREPFGWGEATAARAAIHAELGDEPRMVRLLLEQSHREGRSLHNFHFIPFFDPVRDHPDVRDFFPGPSWDLERSHTP